MSAAAVLVLLASPAALHPPRLPSVQCTRFRALKARLDSSLEAPATEFPEVLLGPWELRSTMSGAQRLWVELGEQGALSCSSSFGKGKSWSAEALQREQWTLRFVLLDKLKRPIEFEGTVADGEVHSLVLSGKILGPPPRNAMQAAPLKGVVMGEFEGYKLD